MWVDFQAFLFPIYIIIFVFQIIFLVKAMKRNTKRKWTELYSFEALSTLLAFGLFMVYEHLPTPSSSLMPGLTYFSGVIFSLGAMILYGIMIAVSVILHIIRHFLTTGKSNNMS